MPCSSAAAVSRTVPPQAPPAPALSRSPGTKSTSPPAGRMQELPHGETEAQTEHLGVTEGAESTDRVGGQLLLPATALVPQVSLTRLSHKRCLRDLLSW